MKMARKDRNKNKTQKYYTCACGATMVSDMNTIRAHAIVDCPNIKRAVSIK
jgi:hypothetical protein